MQYLSIILGPHPHVISQQFSVNFNSISFSLSNLVAVYSQFPNPIPFKNTQQVSWSPRLSNSYRGAYSQVQVMCQVLRGRAWETIRGIHQVCLSVHLVASIVTIYCNNMDNKRQLGHCVSVLEALWNARTDFQWFLFIDLRAPCIVYYLN